MFLLLLLFMNPETCTLQAKEGRVLFQTSPALLMKDTKNEVEAQGMHNAHIRDAVALCQFLSKIENEVNICYLYVQY